MCDRWNSFENFLEDMEPSYVEGLTLHRKDSSKGYEPGNVVWADWNTQNNESANVRIIEIDGESKTLTQWCEQMGLNKNTFHSRIFKGWPLREAILTPTRVR